MPQANTCYLCGRAGKGFRPAVQSADMIGSVIGIHPKTFESWGICPNCRIALGKGTRAWMEKYIPRGFIPYAWSNEPKALKGGWKKRRSGSGRPSNDSSSLEAVSMRVGDKLIEEFKSLQFLNQHDKARFFERLAEQQGVLHLLKPSQESCASTVTVEMSRVKLYASELSLSQRKVERLARLDYGGGTTKVVVRPHVITGGHGCLVLLHGDKDSRA
ncbi:hypothetical protein FOZ62_025716, partial [Perkinsus olseni]